MRPQALSEHIDVELVSFHDGLAHVLPYHLCLGAHLTRIQRQLWGWGDGGGGGGEGEVGWRSSVVAIMGWWLKVER